VFTSLAIYHCFFTRIYDYRSNEILNMRKIPFVFKAGISCSISFLMCYKMWEDHLYDPELYKLAVKHRFDYDFESKERLAVLNYEESKSI